MRHKTTIYFRLLCGFGIVLVLTLLLGLFAFGQMKTLANLTVIMHDHPLTVSNAVRDINSNILAMHRTMKDVASAKTEDEIHKLITYVNTHEQEVFEHFNVVSERFLGSKDDVKNAQKAFSDWKEIRQEVVELMLEGKQAQAQAITKGKGNDHVNDILKKILVMSDFAGSKAEEYFAQSQEIIAKQYLILTSLIIIIVSISAIVGIIISRKITVPIANIINEFREIAKGDFNRKVNVDGLKEIDQLADEFNKMTSQLKKSTTSIKLLNEEIDHRIKLEEGLRVANQQLACSEQQLKASNQQLRASEQQLKASNQQLSASGQQLKASNQQLTANEQQLLAADQDMRLNESRLEVLLKLNQMKDASVSEMADFVSEESIRLTKSDMGFFGFIDESQGFMRIHAWSQKAMAECRTSDKPLIFPIENAGVWANCIKSRKAVIINDYSSHHDNKKGVPEGHVELKRLISLPVFEGDTIVAVAAVANKLHDYTDSDVKQLELLFHEMWEMICYQKAQRERDLLLKELEFKNNELQGIVHITSHDLKSPLVNIKGFSSFLQNHCKELLNLMMSQDFNGEIKDKVESLVNASIEEDLGFIISSTDRMTRLIDGLGKISRIGTSNISFRKVDMNKLMSEIFETVKYQTDKNNTEIILDDLVPCHADEEMIKHVFTNLVDNAIKYFKPNQKGSIEVSGYKEGDDCVYCIKDNGIGMKSLHKKKIFDLYHRLEPQGNVEGEGLGLTIVKSIVGKHNGKIWVESEENEGSKFFVSFPSVD
ncbi:MAG: GAF domain-containing protein [Phycisphaerae bacterium]|nr:GAF domain-containing protein [Phycisphaerae bacterium]